MDEDEKKQVVSALRATITSQKGGVELRVLNSDYRELEGENIPFRQCGFSSLEAYIRSLSNDFSIVPRDGSLYVIAKKTEALAHLQDLVSGQAKKKSSKKGGYKPRGKFTGGYNTAFNNRSGPPHRPAPRSSGPPCYNRNSSLQGRVPGSRPQSYNTSSKPRAASSGGGGYYDRDQESRNNDWSAPSARQPSPVRRKSPPRERHEPTTSASRNREPAAQPAQKKREAPAPLPPPIIRKMPEHLQSPKPTPPPQVDPAPSSRPLPRLLSQLAKEDSLNKANKESKMLNLQITLPNDYYVGPPATQVEQEPLHPPSPDLYPPTPPRGLSSPSLVEQPEPPQALSDTPPDDSHVPSSLKLLLKKLASKETSAAGMPDSYSSVVSDSNSSVVPDSFSSIVPDSYSSDSCSYSSVAPDSYNSYAIDSYNSFLPDTCGSSVAPDSYSSYLPDSYIFSTPESYSSLAPDSYHPAPDSSNSFVPISFTPSDTSTLVRHLESLHLHDSAPESVSGTLQGPDMTYLKSLLTKLKKESVVEEPVPVPVAAAASKPEPTPSIRYLKSLLHKLQEAPRGGEGAYQSPPSPHYPPQLPVAVSPYYPPQLPVAASPLPPPLTAHYDAGAPFDGATHTFAVDRTQSAFQPYMSDPLDEEVLIATQAYQAPPMLPSHLYTSPPPKSPGPHTSLPASLVSPPLPPSLPSPSLSLLNGASSSKSSSPEVYIDLPAGASPEQQLSHLCRYLFSEEPDVQIKQRATDPRGKNFTFYAFIQVGVHPRISTLPNDYPSRDAAHSAVIQLALAQLTKLKDEKMAKALKKTTDKLNILIERIYSLVRHAHNGLVAAKVEEMYEEKYGEVLPAGWSQLAEVTQHPRLEVNSTPICTIVYAKTLQTESHSAGAPLPPLVLPEENEWPVFSSVMTSVCSVYVRLVNDSCNLFYKLSDDLDSFMSDAATKPAPVTQARPGQLCTLHDEECWHRVRVLEVRGERGNTALVRFIDHGEESEHPLEELYPLYDQFRTMPAQAIELFLPECQSFAELLDHHLVEAEIVGKPLVAVVDRQDHLPGETTYSATLYNTEQEPAVNVNHLVFQQICDLFNVSSLPDENMFKESVFVSYISSAESCVYVQVESLMFQYLQSSIAALVDSAALEQHRVGLASALAACRAEVFLARYDSDGQYYRARLITVDPIGNKVTVRFIDYGNTSDVSCQNLIKLFETTHHSHLCLIPPQAKQVKLAGLEVFTPEVMTKLTTLLNGTEPVILKMSAGRAQIHKRDSQGKIVGINNLVLSSNGFKDPHLRSVPSKELDASPLDPPVTPPLNEFIDVLVESISSPTNFWIRPEESYNNWVEMMDEMDDYYSQNEKTLPPVAPEDIRVGACFVCPYEELDLWQRVTIHSRISPDSVALFLADLGKIITADTSRLRYLAPQFRQLPAIAIKAKLHDIKPAFVDWTPADIVRFQALCEGGGEGEGGGGGAKVLKCRVESITPDVLTHGGEHAVLSVRLLDSHGPKDIDLASCLVVEGRAKMAE